MGCFDMTKEKSRSERETERNIDREGEGQKLEIYGQFIRIDHEHLIPIQHTHAKNIIHFPPPKFPLLLYLRQSVENQTFFLAISNVLCVSTNSVTYLDV